MLELPGVAALDEEAVRIVSLRQGDTQSVDSLSPEAERDLLCGALPALIGVGIEGQVDRAGAIAQLAKLTCIEMASHRTGDVVEARLPQDGEVEQAFDQDDVRAFPKLVPAIQAAFVAGQKPVPDSRCSSSGLLELQWNCRL